MATGTLIAESLRLDAPLSTPTLRLRGIVRRCFDGLPPVWTFVEFEVDDTEAGTVADGLTAALAEPLGGTATSARRSRPTRCSTGVCSATPAATPQPPPR